MKNNYFLTILLLLVGLTSYSQGSGNEAPIVKVEILTPVSICQPGDCTQLTAEYFVTKPTTSYEVAPIAAQNIYSFTGGIPLVVTTDDVWSPTFELPFTFNFYGQSFNKVLVGSNGVITFDIQGVVAGGQQSPGGYCPWSFGTPVPNAGFPIKNAIYGVYQDTNMSSPPITNANLQNVNYYVGGTAPNRYFVTNFNRLPQFSCNGTLGATVAQDVGLQTSQIVIYETTNIIDVYIQKRSFCGGWNGGNGVVGVQNQSGSAGATPPGRNSGAVNPNWNTTDEAYRFTPNGVGPDLVTLQWTNPAGEILGTTNPLTVCIDDLDEIKNIIATVTYTNGTVISTADDDIDVAVAPPLPVNSPIDISVCTENPIDISQTDFVLDPVDPFEYEVFYFLNEAAANSGATSQALTPTQVANFTTATTDPVTVYVYIENTFGNGCFNVRPFVVQIGNPSGTFSYPPDTDETPASYCFNSNSALTPVLDDLTSGGTYSVIPANSGDVLTINPTTGVLDLTGATPGTYEIKYTIPAGPAPDGCPEYNTSTNITIESCINGTVSNSGPLCQGTATFLLNADYTETGGVTTTYEWKDSAGVVVSTDQDATDIPVPADAGSYTYSLVITQNGTPSEPFETILIVHPKPTASFVSVSTTICTNASTTLVFTGTPNTSLNISDGSNTFVVPIDASGNGEYVTPALATDTVYSLGTITGATVPACSETLTGSIQISVGLPTASIVEFEAPVICSGTETGLKISGTPGSIVSYTKDGAAQTDVTLPASGLFTINTGIQTVTTTTTYTYSLTNVISNSTPPCSDTITGQSATLTVNALPTATIVTTTPSICEGTSATLKFTGTANAIVTYNNGTANLTTTLDAAGTATVTTAAISATTTYFLVSVEVASSGVTCSQPTTGNVIITITPSVAITSPTANYTTTVCPGTSQTFSVVATGANPTYQWYKNGTLITANATSESFTINPVLPSSAGDYTVKVSGDCGAPFTSVIATLVVSPETKITVQPVTPPAVCEGTPVSLSVSATGGGTLTYQWFKGTTAIAGATSENFSLNNPVASDSGSYTCKVTGTCGTATSTVVVVTINQAPAIASQPENQTICVGEKATFKVQATGTTLIYQWYKGTAPIANENSNTLSIPNATEADSGTFYCEISSASCASIQTVIVTLLVKPLPVATIAQGNPSTICAGESTQVIFNGTAGAVVIYTINGGTEETITLNANVPTILATGTLNETTVYELVRVTYTGVDACSQALTGSVTVNVNPLPTVTLEDGFICIDPVTLAVTRPYLLNTGLNEAEFTFEWSDANGVIPFASNSFYEANVIGQYGVTITDIVTGCKGSAFANVDQSSPPTDFDYTVSGFFADNPTVVITATPAGQYEYQMDYGPFQESNVFDNITAGTHTITVRDPQACDVLTKEVLIIDYPRYFTPNGDGINDTWNIRSSALTFTKIHIFDRFGKLIKEMSASDSASGWDGTYNGRALPATDYWFTIKYQEGGIAKEFRSHFAMKR